MARPSAFRPPLAGSALASSPLGLSEGRGKMADKAPSGSQKASGKVRPFRGAVRGPPLRRRGTWLLPAGAAAGLGSGGAARRGRCGLLRPWSLLGVTAGPGRGWGGGKGKALGNLPFPGYPRSPGPPWTHLCRGLVAAASWRARGPAGARSGVPAERAGYAARAGLFQPVPHRSRLGTVR